MQVPSLKDAHKRTKNDILVKTSDYKVPNDLKKIGVGKKYFIKTYGCQMNEHDSENIKAMLEDMSFKEGISMDKSDIVILNTCAIRENAHNKAFGMLGRLKHLKEQNPNLIVGLCGCMAQEESVVNEILSKYKWVDIVFGTHNLYNLPNILKKSLENGHTEIDVLSIEGDVIENIPVKRDNKYKAWVNIMYGCDKFCTYCIVPYTRGKQRSRYPEFILQEVNALIKDGYKEVTLLGQNVNAYGKDLNIKYDMANLLEDVAKTGIERIRFVSPHPKDFSDDVIEAIRDCEKVCKIIHLPLQSGSSRILKKMNRKYNKEQFLDLVEKMKNNIPGLALSTDIIVGFPGETEEDFSDTLDVVDKVNFEQVYMFIYSRRVGTPADKMEDHVPEELKHERFNKLKALVERQIDGNNKKYVTTIQKVRVEGKSKTNDKILTGRTDTNKVVNFEGDNSLIGNIIEIKIISEHMWYLKGQII